MKKCALLINYIVIVEKSKSNKISDAYDMCCSANYLLNHLISGTDLIKILSEEYTEYEYTNIVQLLNEINLTVTSVIDY